MEQPSSGDQTEKISEDNQDLVTNDDPDTPVSRKIQMPGVVRPGGLSDVIGKPSPERLAELRKRQALADERERRACELGRNIIIR